ncbi:cellulose binding domain-containing protein [Cohnella sp. AR92]|uniref:cellulose binding domain-containing protein n=1 Tax=Cohnella sp. AR92 TaxID=648716 RepID=UPI00351A7C7B
MFNGTTAASTQSINPRIRLVNTGTTAVSLSNVKIRYYYTIDGDKAQSFFCDWATAGSANVTGAFTKLTTAKTGADYYLEIGFASGAGSLAAGASTDLQIRFSKTDWTNYSQSDDYSYDSADTAYVDWTKAPAYLSGSLAWGVEP